MNITNKRQLALLWFIKKHANTIFEWFVWTTIIYENTNLFKRGKNKETIQAPFWKLKTKFDYDPFKNQYLKKREEILTSSKSKAEWENKYWKTILYPTLYREFFTILILHTANIDPTTKNHIPFDIEHYNLLRDSMKDPKLSEVIQYALSQIWGISNNILKQENESISKGVYQYNPINKFKFLNNLAKKTFKNNLSIRYANERTKFKSIKIS